MNLINKTLDLIAGKVDTSEERKKEIENYKRVRSRLIKIMIKTSKLSKFRLFLITQFMTFFSCGKIKTAPGTVASFMTVAIWFFITITFAKNNTNPIIEICFWSFIIIIFKNNI